MMTKLGVSTYSFYRHMQNTGATLADVCDLAKSIGFDGIEFLTLPKEGEGDKNVMALAESLREHCAKIQLPIVAYTVGGDLTRGDLNEETRRIMAQVDIASALGAPMMRHDCSRGYESGWREAVRRVAPAVREITEYAAASGVRTCTENHGFFLQDADRVEELMLAVNHENYGWLVDMGNFACADEDSVHAVTIAAPYAFHVHIKDFLIKPRRADDPGSGWFRSRHGRFLRGTVPGHGVIPIKSCVDILRGAGYQGWFSYEFEGMEENLPALEAGLAFMRRLE